MQENPPTPARCILSWFQYAQQPAVQASEQVAYGIAGSGVAS
jgi:hypothetical protein